MPTAPVNDTGAVIYYDDSGAPPNSSHYTTVVIVHGLVFYGASFLPMFPFASSNNFRLIALNLRDYPGSTPYSPSELDALRSPGRDVDQQKAAIRTLGLEISAFLKHIITTAGLPKISESDGRKTGGVVLMSWSLGNIWSLSMLANAEYLDDETKVSLHSYLRTLVMYEPPYLAFGLTPPKELAFPRRDTTSSPAQLGVEFCRGASTFYTPQSELTDDMSVLARRVPMHTGSADTKFTPTYDRLSKEQAAAMIEFSVLGRSGRLVGTTDSKVLRDIAESAICGAAAGGDALRNVDVLVLWCDMTHSLGLYAVKHLENMLAAAVSQGKCIRKTEFVKVEEANHMIHIEDPEKFTRLLAEYL